MKNKFRTIFLSDIHLGSKGCNVEALHDFLKHNEAETIILIGDIIDFWSLKRSSFWPTSHNTIVQKFLKMSRHGTKIYYIPGNHDEALRQYFGMTFGDIQVVDDFIYTLASGKRMLCTHGDKFDIITKYHKWIAVLGDIGYSLLLDANKIQNYIRQKLKLESWSLSSFVKRNVKEAVSFISEFEINVAKEAKALGVDIVCCGHIHHSEIKDFGDIVYANTGDWVESCTALTEDFNGNLSILNWKIL